MMIKQFAAASLVCFTVLIGACAPTINNETGPLRSTDTRTAEIKRLEESLSRQPTDLIVRFRLGELYSQLSEQTGNYNDRFKAVKHYLFVEEKTGWNPAAALSAYPHLLHQIDRSGAVIDNSAEKLFKKYPLIRESGFAPPSYAKALHYLRIGNDQEKVTGLLSQSIKDNPAFGYSYLLLSRHHATNNRTELSKAIIFQAGRLIENQADVIEAAALTTLDDLYKNSCPSPRREGVKFAIELYNKLLKLRDDLGDRRELATLYQSLGRYRLELAMRTKIAESTGTVESKAEVANSYYLVGNSGKALSELNALNDASPEDRSVISSLALVNFATGNWEKSRQFYLQLTDSEHYFFDVLNLAITSAFVGENTRNRSFFSPFFQQKKITKWEQSLQDFWSKSLDYNALLSLAENPCQLTEAKSVAGYANLLDGDEDAAIEMFQAVADLMVYDYVEYPRALYQLKQL